MSGSSWRNGTGWLRRNPKWYAAKEFNDYVRLFEATYADLQYYNSRCAAVEPTVGYVTIDSTYSYVGNPPDTVSAKDTSKWVQIGVYQDIGHTQYFMLVNRRCDSTGGRWIHVTLAEDAMVNSSVCAFTQSQSVLVSSGWDDQKFSIYIPPATGCLFQVDRGGLIWPDTAINAAVVIRGNLTIGGTVTINTAGSLTILPGSCVTFVDDGTLTAYGQVKFLGKYDTGGDSTITVRSLSSDVAGLITLQGSLPDTITYTKFKHLDKGLKISKTGTNKVVINNCDFAYNKNEGLYVSGGEVKATTCSFANNAGDGGYFYNTKATLDSLTVSRNEKNGIYFYSANSASSLKHSTFVINGQGSDSNPQGNLMFYGCSPKLEKNSITNGAEYGLYGANGSYPLLTGTTSADNTIGGNASHETYWNASYPSINNGHNNFDVADDTIIYITNTSLSTFFASYNYWGGGAPNTGSNSKSYYGPGTFFYSPYDASEMLAIRGEYDETGLKGGGKGFGERISEAADEAQAALEEAVAAETDRPNVAFQNYRRIIERFGETSAAPIAVERLLWMVRNNFADDNERNTELDRLSRFYSTLSDTSQNRGLAWKARRAALWALAAQHRYDEAIRGFEAIVDRHDNLADSIFAVIDVGTLQLEAREWAARDTGNHVQSMSLGSKHELCPVNFEAHRKHTDELLGMLAMTDGARRSAIPTEYSLDQNYPNPFNAVTQIKYALPEATDVKLRIYDLSGREVITLIQGPQKAGYYRMLWDGRNSGGTQVASGMYFVRLETPAFTKVNKMTLVK